MSLHILKACLQNAFPMEETIRQVDLNMGPLKGPSHIQHRARPTSLRAKKRIFARLTAGVCSITAGSAAIFRDRPAFAGHRNLFLIQRFSNGRISDLRNMLRPNLYVLFMRGADVGWSPPERGPGVNRFTNYRLKLGRCPTPVSLLTGAGRFLITSFRRAPPEPRPKCDRVHFKQKIRLTPWRIWNSPTFGRSTISAGDRWICDVCITWEPQASSTELWLFLCDECYQSEPWFQASTLRVKSNITSLAHSERRPQNIYSQEEFNLYCIIKLATEISLFSLQISKPWCFG